MSYIFVLLLGVIASSQASLICPIPDYPLCGTDGRTYKNICEWQLATLLNPALELLHLGPCKESAYGLYRALLQGNGNMLRSRNQRGRKNKRLNESPPVIDSDNYNDDLIQRLADLQFNFRRDQEIQEEQQED